MCSWSSFSLSALLSSCSPGKIFTIQTSCCFFGGFFFTTQLISGNIFPCDASWEENRASRHRAYTKPSAWMNYYCSFTCVITMPPPPPTCPPCDILSAHSTTRSLQIPFPWIEFSHNCLPGADFTAVCEDGCTYVLFLAMLASCLRGCPLAGPLFRSRLKYLNDYCMH